jgi:hypothetical protein
VQPGRPQARRAIADLACPPDQVDGVILHTSEPALLGPWRPRFRFAGYGTISVPVASYKSVGGEFVQNFESERCQLRRRGRASKVCRRRQVGLCSMGVLKKSARHDSAARELLGK